MEFILPMCILICFNLTVILGNSLVITAVFTSQKLRSVTNMFIVSLAVADLMLGIMVLPYSSANEVLRYWPFGTIWCSAWLAVDVWLSTASIFNLCAISLDRYLAITHPFRYPRLMSPTRGKILVASVWIGSFLICFPPLIGWNERSDNRQSGDVSGHLSVVGTNGSSAAWAVGKAYFAGNVTYYLDEFNSTVDKVACEEMPVCQLTSSRGYVIYSALGSFWIPVWIMVFFYWRIYLTAARTSGALRRGVLTTRTSGLRASSSDMSVTLRVHRGGGGSRSPCNGDGSSMRLLSVKDAYHRPERHLHSPKPERRPAHNGLQQTHIATPSHGQSNSQREIEYTQLHERSYNEFIQKKPPKMLIRFKKSSASTSATTSLNSYSESGSGNQGSSPTVTIATLPLSSPTPRRNSDCRVEIEESDILRDEESATSGESRPPRLLSRMGRIQLKSQIRRINKERKAAKDRWHYSRLLHLLLVTFLQCLFIGCFLQYVYSAAVLHYLLLAGVLQLGYQPLRVRTLF